MRSLSILLAMAAAAFFLALAPLALADPAEIHAPAGRLDLHVSQGVMISTSGDFETIFVAEPEIASYQVVNPRKVLVFGRLPGQTTLLAMDSDGAPVYSANVLVRYDTSQMTEALNREFPSLKLKLTPAADGIAVSGVVPSAQVAADVIALLDSFVQLGRPSPLSAMAATASTQRAESGGGEEDVSGAAAGSGTMASRYGRIINRLTVSMPTQVTIRVKVAEVSRDLSDQLGIRWFYNRAGTARNHSFFFGLIDSPVAFSELGDELDFGAMIDALAQERLVSILAEPNLTVMSGETASFLAGGQMPVPSPQGDDKVTIEYKDYGVLLGVTPTILSEDRVSIRIRPEVSEPSMADGITTQSLTVPAFIVRRAETTVELASGQSFAIGGLIQSNLVNEVSKFPILGDLPIIGALARSTSFQRGETELLIIATAYISEPAGGELQIPNATVAIPSFVERLFFGSKPKVGPGPLAPADFLYY
jgi:pilus assembly protein CpaC